MIQNGRGLRAFGASGVGPSNRRLTQPGARGGHQAVQGESIETLWPVGEGSFRRALGLGLAKRQKRRGELGSDALFLVLEEHERPSPGLREEPVSPA